ncbi:MAG: hypothetical protein WC120_03300 [Parcubacteria group bacterium]
MLNIQSLSKKPNILIAIILAVFFFKGIFLVALHPIFDGQDEARHYANIQYFSHSEDNYWDESRENIKKDDDQLETYGFSEEIGKTSTAADSEILRSEIFNTIRFSEGYDGKNEHAIRTEQWASHIYSNKPEIIGGLQFYHHFLSFFEKTLSYQDILTRFFIFRIFSVFLATIAIYISFLIAKNSGLSIKNSLLISTIISFHPKFSDYLTNINYDAFIIPIFFFFTLNGILALKNGPGWKNLSLMLLSAILAFLTKGTGIVLFVAFIFLVFYLIFEKIKNGSPLRLRIFYFFSAICILCLGFFSKKYLPLQNGMVKIFETFTEYIDKSLTLGKLALSSRTYWGNVGWVDSWLLSHFTNIIWIIQVISVIGLILYFFTKNTPSYLPRKKYAIFFLGMIFALQLSIRAFDWRVYVHEGIISLGTPGRYFLPNLVSHIILFYTGLGMLFHKIKKEHFFEYSLKLGAILMFSLSMYIIFDVIIYRFYL